MAGELIEQGMSRPKLTEQAARFCDARARGHNVFESAVLAGYASLGKHSGFPYQLEKRADIQIGIEYYRRLYASQSDTSPEKIIAQLATMANVDVTQTVDNTWNTLEVEKLPEDVRKAITGIEVRETRGNKRVTLKFGKEFAIDKLMQIYRMGADNSTGKEGFSLTINLGQQMSVEQGVKRSDDSYLDIKLDQE